MFWLGAGMATLAWVLWALLLMQLEQRVRWLGVLVARRPGLLPLVFFAGAYAAAYGAFWLHAYVLRLGLLV